MAFVLRNLFSFFTVPADKKVWETLTVQCFQRIRWVAPPFVVAMIVSPKLTIVIVEEHFGKELYGNFLCLVALLLENCTVPAVTVTPQ